MHEQTHDNGSKPFWYGQIRGRKLVLHPEEHRGQMIVDTHRLLLRSPMRRLELARITVILSFLSALLLCANVWGSNRELPLAPVLPFMPTVPQPYDQYVFYGLLALLIGGLVAIRPRAWFWAVGAVVGVLVMGDILRLQPWALEYTVLLIAMGFARWSPGEDDAAVRIPIEAVCRIAVGGIYFWSGVHKISASFVLDAYPRLIKPFYDAAPEFLQPAMLGFGWVIPFLETALAILLFIPRIHKVGVVGIVCMHIFLLVLLGPLGINYNTVVWPWNIAMALLCVSLFWGNREPVFSALWARRSPWITKVAFAMYAILPVGHFFDVWDTYPSAALYSGNETTAAINFRDSAVMLLPSTVQRYVKRRSDGTNYIPLVTWSLGELNVPGYPQERVWIQLAEAVRAKYGIDPEDCVLQIHPRRSLLATDANMKYIRLGVGH